MDCETMKNLYEVVFVVIIVLLVYGRIRIKK